MGSLHSNDTCSGSLNSFIREPNKTASPNFVETRYQQVVGLCWWVSRHWARQLELGAEVGLSLAVVAVVYWTTPGIEQQAAKPFPRRRRLKMSKKQITLWGTSTPNQNCRQPTRPFLIPLHKQLIGLEMTLLRNIFFWSFLTKTKQERVLPGPVYGKIWPHSTQFSGVFSLVYSTLYC